MDLTLKLTIDNKAAEKSTDLGYMFGSVADDGDLEILWQLIKDAANGVEGISVEIEKVNWD